MRNGLTAEGLASPFVRVTRLFKVAPPPQRPKAKEEEEEEEEERGGGKIKSLPLAASSPRLVSHHPVGVRPAAPSSHAPRGQRELEE